MAEAKIVSGYACCVRHMGHQLLKIINRGIKHQMV